MEDFITLPMPVKAIQWFPGVKVEDDRFWEEDGYGHYGNKSHFLVIKSGWWIVRFEDVPELCFYPDGYFKTHFARRVQLENQ